MYCNCRFRHVLNHFQVHKLCGNIYTVGEGGSHLRVTYSPFTAWAALLPETKVELLAFH